MNRGSTLKVAPMSDDNAAARAALADAIAAADAVQARREVVDQAIRRAEAIVDAAAVRHEEAAAGVTLARAAHGDRVAAAATDGTTLSADSSLRNARLAEAEALDELEAARLGLERLHDENAAHKIGFEKLNNIDAAMRDVDGAVDRVFRTTSLDKLVAETAAIQRDLIERRLVLFGLMQSGLVSEDTTDVKALHDLMMTFQLPQYDGNSGTLFGTQHLEIQRACREWRGARETMKSDANAPLPW